MYLIMTKRMSALIALILIPTIFALIGGFYAGLGAMMLDGVKKLAPTGVMLTFSILYFGLMIDAGLFDPLVRFILRMVRGDPLKVLVGTASWSDKSLVASKKFYPQEARTPEARLRFYATQFPLVEVDTSYYAIPTSETAQAWVDRTPAHFTLNVKAFRLFTGHATSPSVLPPDLRAELPKTDKATFYFKDVPPDLRDQIWQRFKAALAPLREAGKLGMVHFQFAPYTLRHASWDDAGAVVQQRAIDTLAQYAPAFKSSIKHVHTITPRDLEATYGLSEGDLNHGQLILDQMFFMRPLPGWSNHKTPIEGLYLCGSGVHGGGGISGSSGRNAARIAK